MEAALQAIAASRELMIVEDLSKVEM